MVNNTRWPQPARFPWDGRHPRKHLPVTRRPRLASRPLPVSTRRRTGARIRTPLAGRLPGLCSAISRSRRHGRRQRPCRRELCVLTRRGCPILYVPAQRACENGGPPSLPKWEGRREASCSPPIFGRGSRDAQVEQARAGERAAGRGPAWSGGGRRRGTGSRAPGPRRAKGRRGAGGRRRGTGSRAPGPCRPEVESLMLNLSILLIYFVLALVRVGNHVLSKLCYIKERLSPTPPRSYWLQGVAASIRRDERTGLGASVCAWSGGCDE